MNRDRAQEMMEDVVDNGMYQQIRRLIKQSGQDLMPLLLDLQYPAVATLAMSFGCRPEPGHNLAMTAIPRQRVVSETTSATPGFHEFMLAHRDVILVYGDGGLLLPITPSGKIKGDGRTIDLYRSNGQIV